MQAYSYKPVLDSCKAMFLSYINSEKDNDKWLLLKREELHECSIFVCIDM